MSHSVEVALKTMDWEDTQPTETPAEGAKEMLALPLPEFKAAQLVGQKKSHSFHFSRGKGRVGRTLSCILYTSSDRAGEDTGQNCEAPVPGPSL